MCQGERRIGKGLAGWLLSQLLGRSRANQLTRGGMGDGSFDRRRLFRPVDRLVSGVQLGEAGRDGRVGLGRVSRRGRSSVPHLAGTGQPGFTSNSTSCSGRPGWSREGPAYTGRPRGISGLGWVVG